ncbi:MAG: ion channel, partial [Oceanococcus sp.]
NHGGHQGYHLNDCDLYRADMEHAHCFMLDLSGSSLMKANLRHANLHRANLEGCNLLGTIFENARIEKVNWGEKVRQEIQAEQAEQEGDDEECLNYYQQAEEVYRNLRKTAEVQGLFETAGRFFKKEMMMRRKQMPKRSVTRFISLAVDIFCGYGEDPMRVVLFSWMVIVTFALIYSLFGLSFSGESLALDVQMSLWANLKIFMTSLYFSIVTFTTLGYGDLAPIGFARAFAAVEAFVGSFTLALFVVVFVKKMTR